MSRDKVLVTGGSGLLGRFVVRALAGTYDVAVLDLKPPVQDVTYHQADITDADAVSRAMLGASAVVHLAGYDDGDAPRESDYMSVNLQGAWTVFQAAEQSGVSRVIAASSMAAVGIGRDSPPDYLPIDEAHPLRPRRAYDLGKQMMEAMGAGFARRSGMAVAMLRPTLIVRPEKAPEMIAELNDIGEDQGISVAAPRYGGLPLLRAWISSRDCARAFAAALSADFGRFGVFTIAADDTLGGAETLGRYEAVFDKPAAVTDTDRYVRCGVASPLDNRLAKQVLGWSPRDRWPDIVGLVAFGADTFESWE